MKGFEMEKVAWRAGRYKNSKADAQTVYGELKSIGDSYRPDDVVEYARQHEDSELHKLFTWDDTVAAENWRKFEARTIIASIVLVKDDKEQTPSAVRAVVLEPGSKSYKPTSVVVTHQTEYEAVLERALSELKAFRKKYEALSELEEIFRMIDTL